MIGGPFQQDLQRALGVYTGEPVSLGEFHPLGGGCINRSGRLETSKGTFFLKYNNDPLPRLFECEAAGLRALREVNAIELPEPIEASSGDKHFPPYLLMTFIETGPRTTVFSERFGRAFARLHKNGTGQRFGFHHDNYIGSTNQSNGWRDDWVEFFREHRLGYQLSLAERNGYHGELQELGGRLLERLGEFIAEPAEPPTLLHGDLWGGNYLCSADGNPVLIDPAVYYGRREADIAMTHLFGGFDHDFYAAYNEEYPLAEGSVERIDIYKLYHLLNHLNLFGREYEGACLAILRRYG